MGAGESFGKALGVLRAHVPGGDIDQRGAWSISLERPNGSDILTVCGDSLLVTVSRTITALSERAGLT